MAAMDKIDRQCTTTVGITKQQTKALIRDQRQAEAEAKQGWPEG